MLFARLLQLGLRDGSLRIIDATGQCHDVGDGGAPAAVIRLHDRALHRQLCINPDLHLGEAYMDGTLTLEQGSLYDFIDVLARNLNRLHALPIRRFGNTVSRLLRRLQQHNFIARSRSNVAHHYDLSDTLYDIFLDKDRQYSCAYFQTDNDTLEVAQSNKKRHIAAKLLLTPGQRVLDVGCGWGGMALYLAQAGAGEVAGITLSQEQHAVATRRARDAGLDGRVHFHLRDYREEDGRYDRIVSVGMFEHVGTGYYERFFTKLRDLLAEDGVALLHSIGRMEPPGTTNAWLRKYIFPGGYAPALSEVLAAVERAGLWVTDIEILRLHYAKTLREWRLRFADNREQVQALYDERFCRMWEFYLTGCEISFRRMGQMVFQMQLARRQDAVPLTRDYITAWERDHSGMTVAG